MSRYIQIKNENIKVNYSVTKDKDKEDSIWITCHDRGDEWGETVDYRFSVAKELGVKFGVTALVPEKKIKITTMTLKWVQVEYYDKVNKKKATFDQIQDITELEIDKIEHNREPMKKAS